MRYEKFRRHKIQAIEVGAADVGVEGIGFALHEPLAPAGDFGFDPKVERRRPLGIEIPNQGSMPCQGSQIGQIDRSGCFAHATFQIVDRGNLHRIVPSSDGPNREPKCTPISSPRRYCSYFIIMPELRDDLDRTNLPDPGFKIRQIPDLDSAYTGLET